MIGDKQWHEQHNPKTCTGVNCACHQQFGWENIIQGGSLEQLERLRVPGGWLYHRQIRQRAHESDAHVMCFVPEVT